MIQASSTQLAYSEGFKYQIRENDFEVFVGDWGQTKSIDSEWIKLTLDGWLTIRLGYAWDGCSGPTIDGRKSMRASVIHDAGYELIRKRFLPSNSKEAVDKTFHGYMVADGMWKFRANYYYWGVDKFGEKSTLPSHKKEILYAP